MHWLELSVTVDPEAVESVAELLAHYGYNSGVVVEPAWTPGTEGPEFRYEPEQPVTLRTYLPLDAQTEETRQRIEQALWHLGHLRPISQLQTRTLAEQDWANAWKEHYHVQRIGKRIVIVPSWLAYTAQPDDVLIHLDPGMAFGTGLHVTTRLCLRLLEHYVQPGIQMLDLGTGSGILAITAAKLGAASVLALDNDPIAVSIARDNVARNLVHPIIRVEQGSLGAGQHLDHWMGSQYCLPDSTPVPAVDSPPPTEQPPVATHSTPDDDLLPASHMSASPEAIRPAINTSMFDLIAANLIARALVVLAQDLALALKPDGILISSGIILERENEVVQALTTAGLDITERYQEGEWVALVCHQ